jgi:hypothetical protein
MTKPQVTSAVALDLPSDAEPRLEAASRTPILLTEHHVMLSTAAAVRVQPNRTRGWIQATHAVAALHRMFLTIADSRPARRYHPALYQTPEDALMAREMHRL